MGVTFEITIEIDASINEVWDKLVDWKSQSDWMALTRVQSSHQGSQDSGIGTTIDAFTGIWKIGILDRMKVVEWNPPKRCVVDHYGRWIKGKAYFHYTRNQLRRMKRPSFIGTKRLKVFA